MTNICIIATIIIYLVAMLLVGFAYSKSNNDSTDFYLGGRKMGPLVTAMSAEASDMSSWLLMGMPGLAYLTGIASPGWTAIGLALGTWLNWLIVARRLRRYSANLEAITVPQFLSLRFHDQRNLLNALGAVIIIVFFVPYTASGFAACGKLFHSLFGVDYMAAMVVSACVIVGYTITGGFRAVTTTDLIQSIVMSLALVAVLVYGIGAAGGWDAVVANAQSLPGYLTMLASHNAAEGTATSYSLLDIVSTMAWGLGYFGMPHILLRFMAIGDEKKLKLSRRVASVWVTVAMALAVLIGIVGKALSGIGAIAPLEGSNTETVIIRIAELFQGRHFPGTDGRSHPGGHSGQHHVHGGFPAAGGILQRVPEPAAGGLPLQAQPEAEYAGGPAHRHRHCHSGHFHCKRPQQFHFRHRLLCLGGLWCGLRPPGDLCPVLDTHHLCWRCLRHGGGGRYGLPLEVPDQAPGRHLRHL